MYIICDVLGAAVISVLARRYNADGQARGPLFRVDPPDGSILGGYESVSVAMNAHGEFVIVWMDQPEGIFAQRYDSAGRAVGGPATVDGPGDPNRNHAWVAMDDTGRFAVLWSRYDGPGADSAFVRHFAADGQPAGASRLVRSTTNDFYPTSVSLDMDGGGDTVVTWSVRGTGIWGQRYAANGDTRGDKFLLAATSMPDGFITGDVAMEDDSDFVLTWSEARNQPQESRISLRQFHADGTPASEPLLVRHDSDQRASWVDVTGDGSRAILVWVQPADSDYAVAQPFAAGDTDANKPPTTTGLRDVTVDAGAADTTVPLFGAFDDDRDADGDLTFTVGDNTNAALFSSVTLDASTGVLTLAFAPGQTGEATLSVSATDTGGLNVRTPLKVTVRPAVPTPDPDPTPVPDPDPNPGTGQTNPPPLPPGDGVVTGRLFTRAPGSRRKAPAAGVQVFLDANDNGSWEANEPVATTTAAGIFSFSGLAPQKYVLHVSTPDGWLAGGKNGRGGYRRVALHGRRHKPARVKPLVLRPIDALP